jgi:hypothetical protein
LVRASSISGTYTVWSKYQGERTLVETRQIVSARVVPGMVEMELLVTTPDGQPARRITTYAMVWDEGGQKNLQLGLDSPEYMMSGSPPAAAGPPA